MSTQVKGSVEYKTIIKDNDGNVKTLAIWTIPDFMESIEDKNIKEIQSLKQKFRFATSWRTTEHLRISYFSSTKPIFLKSVELKTLIFDEDKWKFKEEHSIARKENLIIQDNKWQSLKLLDIDESNGLYVEDNENMRVCLLENGSLCLRFEFVITTIKTKTDDWNIPRIQLKDIFKNIFLEGTYSDVVMKSADGEEFKAHKVLLAGQSPVLKANFDNNFTESTTNIIESPLETAVLHEMLSFIYTDQAKVVEMPEKLLAAADYYQLGRLKSLCEKALYKKLTVDNAVEILQLADLHSTELLTQLTLDFINKDNEQLQLVTKTEGWANLNSIDLIKRIFK